MKIETTHLHATNDHSHDLLIGLDIGGTKIEALAVDQDFITWGQFNRLTDISSPENFVASVTDAIYQVLNQAQAMPSQIIGIGIGIPGQINTETGEVRLAANLNLSAYPLGDTISNIFNVPTFIENDVRLAAIGVYHWQKMHTPVKSIAYLSIGTGVGTGVIINGRLYRGSHGMAGEIGHITVEPNGLLCKCGARGCLETIISGPAIVQQALNAIQFDIPHHEVHAGHVYRAAADGNPTAQAIVQRVSDYISQAIQWLIMTYDVDQVVLGGGVSGAGTAFLTPILSVLSNYRAQSALFATMLQESKIVLLPTGYNAGTWGAVYLTNESDRQPTQG